MSDRLYIVEVGPRDGLQNEKIAIPTDEKVAFIKRLHAAGLEEIEATSFVSPKWVPQLGDAAELWPQLPEGKFSALVPNMKGLERALELGVKRIAVFTAASESFVKKNINMTIDESLQAFNDVVQTFLKESPGGYVRGYVSTIVECPYEGAIDPDVVADVADRLMRMGCDEVCLGETLGVAVPSEIQKVINSVCHLSSDRLAWHFHDTRGTAMANVALCIERGYRVFDASAAGLGGCPYADGAGGNLATEDLVYFAERSGLETGVDLKALSEASLPILQALGRSQSSRVQRAVLAASE